MKFVRNLNNVEASQAKSQGKVSFKTRCRFAERHDFEAFPASEYGIETTTKCSMCATGFASACVVGALAKPVAPHDLILNHCQT